MDTDEALRRDTMANWGVPTEFPPAAQDIRFGPAPGNAMPPEWIAYAVGLWHQAGDKKFTFAEAVKQTAVHFMVGEQP